MSIPPPSEPQPPTFGDPESQARAQAAAERNAPAQPAGPSWQESPQYKPSYPPSGPQFAPYQPPSPPRRSRWYVWLIGGCLALVVVAILGCAVLGGVFAGFLIHVANEVPVSETTTQSFSVTGTPSLNIQDTAGNVEVIQGSTGTVGVEVTKSARATTSDEARTDLNGIHVDVTQTGDTIKVVTTFDQDNGIGRQPRVDLTLTVPPTTNITAQVTTGEVTITGISGLFNLSVVAGNLQTEAVTFTDGSQTHVTTGNLQLAGAVPTGASINVGVDTGQAALELPASTAAHLDARTNVGSVTISGWPLSASKDNVGASAVGDLGTNPQGTITVRVQTGNIDISQA